MMWLLCQTVTAVKLMVLHLILNGSTPPETQTSLTKDPTHLCFYVRSHFRFLMHAELLHSKEIKSTKGKRAAQIR